MIINKSKWHYKVYKWFKGKSPTTSNLCPYFRTVMLYAPLKYLFYKGKIKKVPVPTIVVPPILFEIPRLLGIVSYEAKMCLYVLYVIEAAVATVVASVILIDISKTNMFRKRVRSLLSDSEWCYYESNDFSKNAIPWEIRQKLESKKARKSLEEILESICDSLIVQYIIAKHEKICPIIEFKD